MPNRTGVRISHDIDFRMLKYYKEQLAWQKMNKPPDEKALKKLERTVARYERKIENGHNLNHIDGVFK